MYRINLRSVGNPDFKQYAPISDPQFIQAKTLQEIRAACQKYIDYWALGGGNWVDPIVRQGDKAIGRFSYNLRLWSMEKSAVNPDGTEIVIDGDLPKKAGPAVTAKETPDPEVRKKEVAALRTALRKKGVSQTSLHKALRAMLDYYGDKEEGDFLEADHTAPIGKHIYASTVVIEEYLRGKR